MLHAFTIEVRLSLRQVTILFINRSLLFDCWSPTFEKYFQILLGAII
jgi:hypothetical protein